MLSYVINIRFQQRYSMNSEILIFVNAGVAFQTPSEIFHNFQTSGLPDVEDVVRHQIYYQWQLENKRFWRRANEQFTSATLLLEELDNYEHQIITHANFRGLGIYIRGSIDALSITRKETVIDATFGTKNAGMPLFAILAQFDGTGVPIPYLSFERDTSVEKESASPGAMTQVFDESEAPV